MRAMIAAPAWYSSRVRLAAVLVLCALFAARAAAAQTVQEREPWRPPALQPSATCDVYTGMGSGNDKTQLVEMRICDDGGGHLSGQAQYSGESSGWSVRSLEGAWNDAGDALVLRELAIVDQRPSPGWRFCTIDRYDLARVPGTTSLAGTYDSAACHDHARLSFDLTATVRVDGGDARPYKPPIPASAVPPLPSERRAKRACSCSHPGAPAGGAWMHTPLLFLGWWRRRTRSRQPESMCAYPK
jgi:hypothetical protein